MGAVLAFKTAPQTVLHADDENEHGGGDGGFLNLMLSCPNCNGHHFFVDFRVDTDNKTIDHVEYFCVGCRTGLTLPDPHLVSDPKS